MVPQALTLPSITGERKGLEVPASGNHVGAEKGVGSYIPRCPGTRGGQGRVAGWSEHARPPLRVLHSLLEFLHQVLATDFQFARQTHLH